MPQASHCQPDLFALDDPPVPLAEADRMTLVLLVSALLKESRTAMPRSCVRRKSAMPANSRPGSLVVDDLRLVGAIAALCH